jgi:hypothetical protein
VLTLAQDPETRLFQRSNRHEMIDAGQLWHN